jgi:glycosyltransferase involved in cell wall biosynthesis
MCMKIAIVHDWLYGGGAEKVVEELHKAYPHAPIYTSYCTDEWRVRLDGKVITGYLNHWPFRNLRKFIPLLRQWWFESLDLTEYDVIISSSGNGEARFATAREGAIHISYTHTPTHFYWRKYDEYMRSPGFKPEWLVRFGLKALVGYLRKKDYQAAQQVDYFMANSSHIQADIKKYYNRESEVIHPPVNTARFLKKHPSPVSPSPRFITWGRLVPYKRFDVAIEACNELGLQLDIVGDGPDRLRLETMAGPTIRFLGRASDEDLELAAMQADAFLFPSEEDFGISPVEAMSAGLPVLAYHSGGALDYVVEGKTGVFFIDQTKHSMIQAIKRFNPSKFDSHKIALHAITNFDNKIFRQKVTNYVDRCVAESKKLP